MLETVAVKDIELQELRATLNITVLYLENKTAELHGELEMEKIRRREPEHLLGHLHTDHYGSMGSLRYVYRWLNKDTHVLDL